jgi:hypothetical protein
MIREKPPVKEDAKVSRPANVPAGTPLVKFKKLGKGSFHTKDGRIIKQNQIFLADPATIPATFRDVIVTVEEGAIEHAEEEVAAQAIAKVVYHIVQDGETEGYYNVTNAEGKILSEQVLLYEEAEELVKALTKK